MVKRVHSTLHSGTAKILQINIQTIHKFFAWIGRCKFCCIFPRAASFIHSVEGRRNSVNRSQAQVEKQQQLAGLQNIFPVEVEWGNLLFSFSSSSLASSPCSPFNRMKSSSSREYLRSENIKIWEWMVEEDEMRKWKMSMRSNLNYFSSSSLFLWNIKMWHKSIPWMCRNHDIVIGWLRNTSCGFYATILPFYHAERINPKLYTKKNLSQSTMDFHYFHHHKIL